MGLIKAALGSAGGVLADQWKEYFYCEALPAEVMAVKGKKRTSDRSSNTKGSENIITSGSVIAVADGQCMIIVEQGKVVELCAEPGEFTYDASTEPSIFAGGNLSDNIMDVFQNIGKRFTFGGEAPKDQRVYYFNTKELIGNGGLFMGLFGKLFEKKVCDICGGEIGLLGNKKLEDGNCCKECASKLSPWFDERRHSTVDQIKAQLAYREENKQAVEAFNVTSSFGSNTKLLLDENARRFMVTSAKNPKMANPDVLDFSQVTGVDIDIDENSREEKQERKKADGTTERVSYNPPRFIWSYNFHIVIRVNHPYFDDMRFQLNRSYIESNPDNALPAMRKPDPRTNVEYRECEEMAREIKAILTDVRRQVREEAAAASAPKMAVTCPYCGATTTPDESGCCEFCGGAVNG